MLAALFFSHPAITNSRKVMLHETIRNYDF